MIVDLAAPATARFLIVPGQSANPLSPHYSDLAYRWRDFAWLVLGSTPIVAVTHLLPATANRGE
jgi:acyl-homoserine lactone acylase PvdQ